MAGACGVNKAVKLLARHAALLELAAQWRGQLVETLAASAVLQSQAVFNESLDVRFSAEAEGLGLFAKCRHLLLAKPRDLDGDSCRCHGEVLLTIIPFVAGR